ncbi:hypothetical protein GCM10023187_00990 [Nibrella viscosa]|uniref:Outer membrane lipoprotein-sorting protein n=1 Tax=Nibrella viscosa TaxID=1084524 RepID=A0ABP8JR85_9BACT
MKKLIIIFLLPVLIVSAHAQTLPTADEVINKYIAALGGKKALMKVNNVTSQGLLQFDNSPAQMQITLKRKMPAKALTLITGDNDQLLYKNVINGTNVVEITQQGTTRQNEQAARLSLMYNRLFPELVFKEQGIKSTLVGKEQIDGQDAYKVTSTFADGTPLWISYYDVATGLKVQNVIKWDQSRTATLKSSDYRTVNGVKIPFSSTYQENGGGVSMTKMTSVLVNKGISDAEFNVQ